MQDARATDRGRDGALICAAPPSEPDGRISRIRLSSHGLTSSALSDFITGCRHAASHAAPGAPRGRR